MRVLVKNGHKLPADIAAKFGISSAPAEGSKQPSNAGALEQR